MTQQHRIAFALALLGALIAGLTYPIRANAVEDWEAEKLADRYANVISLEQGGAGGFTTEPFNNAPYIAAWVIAGLLVVCAAIVYGTARHD